MSVKTKYKIIILVWNCLLFLKFIWRCMFTAWIRREWPHRGPHLGCWSRSGHVHHLQPGSASRCTGFLPSGRKWRRSRFHRACRCSVSHPGSWRSRQTVNGCCWSVDINCLVHWFKLGAPAERPHQSSLLKTMKPRLPRPKATWLLWLSHQLEWGCPLTTLRKRTMFLKGGET